MKQVVHLQSRAGAGSPPCSHTSSRLHRGSTLKLKMGLRLFFSSFFVSHLCIFLLSTYTAGEPLEEFGVDFGALARTSASAISYGITQQGFAILGQSHLLFLIIFYCHSQDLCNFSAGTLLGLLGLVTYPQLVSNRR